VKKSSVWGRLSCLCLGALWFAPRCAAKCPMCSQLSPIPRMGDLWRSTLAWWPPLGAQTCNNHCKTTWVWASMIRIWFGQVWTGYPYAKRTDRLLTELHGQFMLAKLFMIDVQYVIGLHFLQNKPPMNNNTHKNIPPVYDPVTNRLDQFCTKEPPTLSQ